MGRDPDRRSKKAAAEAIENLEKDARGWYGGAVGMILLNGDVNTGILIRTTYLRDGDREIPGRCNASLRLGSRNGGARDATKSYWILPRFGPRRNYLQRDGPKQAQAPVCACCW